MISKNTDSKTELKTAVELVDWMLAIDYDVSRLPKTLGILISIIQNLDSRG